MGQRTQEFVSFSRHFFTYALYVRGVIAGLLTLLILGGVTISTFENMPLTDGIYLAFITGLSIGYGDITPDSPAGRAVSIVIGLIGMIFVGISAAVATRALAAATREVHEQPPSQSS